MLNSLSPEITECYEHARVARERADAAHAAAGREHHLKMERRWLLLAHSHEARARLEAFTADARSRLRAFTPAHPAIPRVMCPECGRNMRLRGVEPVVTPAERRADVVNFRCTCSFELQQTIDRFD